MSHPSKLYSNMAWRLGLDVFSRGTAFVINILIARALGVQDFGRFGYALSITQIFYIFTDLGTHLQLVKELGETRARDPLMWQEFFKLKLVLMAACTVVMACLSTWLWHWENPWLLLMMMVWMFSNSLLDFGQSVCNGLGRMELAQKIMIWQRVMVVTGAGAALLFARSLEGVILGLALGSAIGTVLSKIIFFRSTGAVFNWTPHWSQAKAILRRSLSNGVGSTFGAWYLRLGFVILAWHASSAILGEYNAAFRVFEISYMIPGAIMAIGVPHLAESVGQGRAVFHGEIRRISYVIVALAVGWVASTLMFPGLIIRILFGAGYEGAIPVLRVLGLAGGAVFLNHIVAYLMIILNKQKRHALHEMLVFLIGVTLSLLLIPLFGAVGAAIALFGTEASVFLITSAFLLWKWNALVPRNDNAKIPAP